MFDSDDGTSGETGSLIAEFRVGHSDFPLMDTIAAVPDLEIRSQFQPGTGRAVPEKHFVIECDDFDALEDAATADPTVHDYEVVTGFGSGRLYRVRFTEDTFLLSPEFSDLAVQIDAINKVGNRWLFRILARDRDLVRAVIDRSRELCDEFSLDRLYVPTGTGDPHHLDITETQLRTLLFALEEGYFEVPRETSLANLADAFDVSDSAVSVRLRKGVSAVLEQTIDGNAAPDSVE